MINPKYGKFQVFSLQWKGKEAITIRTLEELREKRMKHVGNKDTLIMMSDGFIGDTQVISHKADKLKTSISTQ